MTVSEYMFDFVKKIGCNKVFMVSGSSAMWLTDALYNNENLDAICCHHEQAAAMAADGYGRINNIPGVCLVTIGPGAMNAITGVAQAFVDSSPVFIFSGNANSKLLQYEIDTKIRQHGTQSLNLEPIVSSITKYFAVVMRPEDIQFHMEKAYYEAITGRKGPVWIDVPVDIQNRQIPKEMIGFIPKLSETTYKKEDIYYVIQKLQDSKRPLILAGYGIRSATCCKQLKDIATKLDIPIVTSRNGIDIINTDNPLFVGRPGSYGDRASHFVIQQCDCLLILGSRLSVSTIGYYPKKLAENAIKIMVDIDQKELDKNDVPIDYKIRADLKQFLNVFLDYIKMGNIVLEHKDWNIHCQKLKTKYPNVLPEYAKESPLNSYYFTKILSERVNDSNVIVDTGSVCNIVSQSWIVKEKQRYIISGGLSCMGFWATALGSFEKNKQVIALAGDGSIQMNIQEFATLQYNKLPVKLFIYNNNGYMLIRHNQHNYMQDRFLGVGPDSGLQTPNFVKVAQAYGLKAVKIEKSDEMIYKIDEVLAYDGPVVCEVIVQEFAPIVPRIASKVMPNGSLKAADFDDLYPFLEE